jgi:adenylosuccinate lyase
MYNISGGYLPRSGGTLTGALTVEGQITGTTHIIAGAAGNIGWNSRGFLSAASDGVLRLSNNAGTDFTRLQFGGTTGSFPAIQRAGTSLQARLADNSDYSFYEGRIRTHSNYVAGVVAATGTIIIYDNSGVAYRVSCAV